MKIFNWVHRKFHHKDGFDRNEKKTINTDADTEVLLEQVKMMDMLGGWKDGILTIGTFGFDPLKDFNKKIECPTWEIKEKEEEEFFDEEDFMVDEEDDNNDERENDEINPLLHTALGHGFDEIVSKATNLIMNIDGISLSPIIAHGVVDFDISTNLKYEKMEKRGERITLADLFSADSDNNANCKKLDDHKNVHSDSFKKPRNAIQAKNGILFAKKLLPRGEKDSRPIRKMQRLMTKMLKRKIHPDIDGKIHKKDSKVNPSSVGLGTNNKCGAINESISLLQPQDVVV